MRWLPILLVVLGNVAYHIGQKSVPRGVQPLWAALGMYVVAALTTLLLLPAIATGPVRVAAGAAVHWSILAIGLGIVAIEVGFLLAYRAGWPLSTASLSAGTLLALVLLPIGLVAFRESLSPARGLGFVLCLAGLWLMSGR